MSFKLNGNETLNNGWCVKFATKACSETILFEIFATDVSFA
jgi:hypothetical protein